jgi:hypothetical protein
MNDELPLSKMRHPGRLASILRMRPRITPKPGIIRPLDMDDPRSWDHPSHKEQWLEIAREIGRQIARDEREARRAGPHIRDAIDDDQPEDGGDLR